MNCCNSLCTKQLAKDNSFPCEFCRERRYCSVSCRTEDWKLGHSKVCEETYRTRIRRIEETCPFIKVGQVLSEEEAAGPELKKEDVCSAYEPAPLTGKTSATLGKGSYGEVVLMRNKVTKELVAMKVIEKTNVGSPNLLHALINEINIQKRLRHENIVRLLGHMEDLHRIYIIMEYVDRGNLFQLIRRRGKLPEKETFFFFTQTCSAIHFLHANKLMHRDIKPENLLVTDKCRLKLCDFGCCTQCDLDNRRTFCGTIEYMAPEVIRRAGYGEKADIWSLGVLLYEMLHGYAPFHGRGDQETISMIMENKLTFAPEIRTDARELIQTLLRDDPKERPAAAEIFLLPWMRRFQAEFAIPDRIPAAAVVPAVAPSPAPATDPVSAPALSPEQKPEEKKSPEEAKKEEQHPHEEKKLETQRPEKKAEEPRRPRKLAKGPISSTLVYSRDRASSNGPRRAPASPAPEQNSLFATPKPATPPTTSKEVARKEPAAKSLEPKIGPMKKVDAIQPRGPAGIVDETLEVGAPGTDPELELDVPQVSPEVGNMSTAGPQISKDEAWKARLQSLLQPVSDAVRNHQASGPDTANAKVSYPRGGEPHPEAKVGANIEAAEEKIRPAAPKLEDEFTACFPPRSTYRNKQQAPGRRTTKQPSRAKPTAQKDDNIFHQECRRATLSAAGFMTFHFVEETPLYNVSRFLEDIAPGTKEAWKHAISRYKEQEEIAQKELDPQLIGLKGVPDEEKKEEDENEDEGSELNTSYSSDNYALQRSETVLHAVNYLDELDATPFLLDITDTAEKLTRERERLRQVCNSLQCPPDSEEEEHVSPIHRTNR